MCTLSKIVKTKTSSTLGVLKFIHGYNFFLDGSWYVI